MEQEVHITLRLKIATGPVGLNEIVYEPPQEHRLGCPDKALTNLSKMTMIRQYSREKWQTYWMERLGIKGYFKTDITSVKLVPCQN